MLIGNSRLYGDIDIGKYTFCSHNGQSTVDYLLLNLSDFEILSYFDVLDFNEFSDHAPITLQFNLKSPFKHTSNPTNNETFINRKIIWDDSKTDLFHSQLMNNNEHFRRLISDARSEPIDPWYKILPAYYMTMPLMFSGKRSVANHGQNSV